MAKKNYVLDTNVILTSWDSINSFENNDIIIPLKVLEEVDKHKQRQDTVGSNARQFIRHLDLLRNSGNICSGVRLGKGKGLIRVSTPILDLLPSSFDQNHPDNQIIATALTEIDKETGSGRKNPRKTILVSRDINMRVKCDSIGVLTEEYKTDQVVKNKTDLFTGFITQLVDDEVIDRFYRGENIYFDKEDGFFYPNQFIMLVSSSNEKKTALCRFLDYISPLKKLSEDSDIWGLKPRNKEQTFAADLLRDSNIPFVSLVGKAGTGKTLLATAMGLQQVLEEKKYKHLIISRPIQPMGKDIGYLPGSLEEKMLPWLAPVQDNLKFLFGNDKETLKMYVQNGVIEIEALTYIRGRSISNAFIIIDEAQNLTIHELKTIVTRVGEDTKIVLTGDIEQIDNVYLDETTNGLAYAIEKLKTYDLSGHVTLKKGERSKIATLAAKVL